MTTLFKDDFEESLVPYGGTIYQGDAPGSTITPVTSPTHHGSKSCQFVLNADNMAFLYHIWDWWSLHTAEVYTKFLIRFASLPAIGENVQIFEHDFSGHQGTDVTMFSLLNAGGNLTWRLYYYNPAVLTSDVVPVPAITTNRWYEIQVHSKIGATNGISQLYVDDTSIINLTGLDNDYQGEPYIGTELLGVNAFAWVSQVIMNMDCVETSTTKIATEMVSAPPPIIYPTVAFNETTAQATVTSAVVCESSGARLRHLRHNTPISPWTAQ